MTTCNHSGKFSWFGCLLVLTLGLELSSAGQVTLDGSFGTKGALAGPNYDIPASVGKTAGKNLFHSFGQFDLSQGDAATFSGPNTIQNVLSRVTGGKPSSIDGTIQCTIDGANFYFVNPKGVVFGQNASLDISGSFVVTTADHIKLADGTKFVATNPTPADDALLTSASPAAFGFLGPAPAPVLLQGPGGQDPGPTLAQVPDGKTFAIIAGNIEIRNQSLIAPAGQVALVSVGSAGEVAFDEEDLRSPVDTTSFDQLGNVLIDDLVLIDVSGEGAGRFIVSADSLTIQNNCFVFADTYGLDDGIGIEIRARGSVELINGGFLEAATFGDGNGGLVYVEAAMVHFDGQLDTGGNGGSAIATGSGGIGNSGDVVIEAESIVIENGAGIGASGSGSGSSGAISLLSTTILLDGRGAAASLAVDSFGDGPSGDIHIQADSVEVRNGGEILAQAHASAPGGNIIIETDSLLLANRGVVSASTDGPGNGGSIVIQTSFLTLDGGGDDSFLTGITSAARETFGGGGQGGNISVVPREDGILTLEIANGAQISASTFLSGDGGNIDITATSISLDGSGTGIFANNIIGEGNGGSILVQADSLDIHNGASISAATADAGNGGTVSISANAVVVSGPESETGIFVGTTGAGDAGDITIQSTTIDMTGLARVSADTSGDGDGGNIALTALDSIRLIDGAQILAPTHGSGEGGDIQLRTSSLLLDGQPELGGRTPFIQTEGTGSGRAGDITIEADGLDVNVGRITATSSGAGDAGNISITADAIHLDAHELSATIQTEAFEGSAGDITLTTQSLEARNVALISTRTHGPSEGGDISITTDSLLVFNGSKIAVSTDGDGNAGNLLLSANSIRLDAGEGIFPFTGLEAVAEGLPDTLGAGGTIEILTGSLDIQNGALISASTQTLGDGGSISIEATDVTLGFFSAIQSASFGEGNAGRIAIAANSLDISGGSLLSAFAGGTGAAGDIEISGSTVHLDGAEFGALVDASTFGGTSGNILITADSLLVENGAVVSTQTFDPSVADGGNIQIQAGSTAILAAGQITSSSFGSGAGGQIQIAGTSLELDGGSSIQCSAQGTGNAGGVTLNLDGSVRLAHNSSLSVSSAASDGGNISVIAGDDIRVKDSSITASAANNGGDITLKADKLVYFLNSTLTAEATTGNGGNINIDPPLVVFNNSSINANSADAAGGDISIIASGFLASGTPITASGAQAGTISIQTPDQDITDELASLEEEPIDAETLLQPHCGVKLKNISTFSVLSRGTPVAPNQLLPSLP